MTSKPLDIDGTEMKVGDLVMVVRPDMPNIHGKVQHIDKLIYQKHISCNGTRHPAEWLYLSTDCRPYDAGLCIESRIIRDTKSKENIDLTEWVGEKVTNDRP